MDEPDLVEENVNSFSAKFNNNTDRPKYLKDPNSHIWKTRSK